MNSTFFDITLVVMIFTVMECKGFPELNKTDATQLTCEMFTKSPHCVKLGEKIYLIDSNVKLNWWQADRRCRQLNARLALIENDIEMDIMNTYISQKKFRDLGMFKYWLAATDQGSDGTFYEVESGQPLRYARWGDGFPDNYQGHEDCLNLLWWTGDKFIMNDDHCEFVTHFICEFKLDNDNYC